MRRYETTLVCLAVVANLFGADMSQAEGKTEAAKKERAAVLETVWTELETGDSWQAAALVESKGKPLHVASGGRGWTEGKPRFAVPIAFEKFRGFVKTPAPATPEQAG